MATKDDKKVEEKAVDKNAPEVKTVDNEGTTSTVQASTLADRAKEFETPKATQARPFSDPNGGPKSTPEAYEAEAKLKSEAFDKRETYLDINDPSHANMTYAQLQEKSGADVKNMR